MLREIKVQMHEDQDVYLIFNDVLYTEAEFFGECRVLIDEPEDYEEIEVSYDEEEEEEPEVPEEEPVRSHSRRSRKDEILKCWNGGEKTAKEIAEELGCSIQTVKKYI